MQRIFSTNHHANGAAARVAARSTERPSNSLGLLVVCSGDCCRLDRPAALLAANRWEFLRTPGGIVPPFGAGPREVAAAIDQAAASDGVGLIGVCGQRDCRLADQLLAPAAVLPDTALRPWHVLAEPARRVRDCATANSAGAREILLRQQAIHLATHPAVAAGIALGRLRVVTWLYDSVGDELYFPNDGSGEFDRLVAFDPAQNIGLRDAAIRRPRPRAVQPVFDPRNLELA